jgi:hypothetical protein
MNNPISNAHTIFFGGLLFGSLFTSSVFAACDPQLPNLRPLPASDIQLVLDQTTNEPVELRFGATNWNSGHGRLELRATDIHTGPDKQQVNQRIYDTCGGFEDIKAGDFVWHPDPSHNHFHFEGFANYSLRPVGNPNQGRNGSKTSFCIMDTTSINPQLWGATGQTYTACGNTIQGMSVAWGDTYGRLLEGQSIDATKLYAGDYELEINVDPFDRIEETNEDDNWSCVLLTFVGSPYATTFNIQKRRSGRCSDPVDTVSIDPISPIWPYQVPPGWTGVVTIKGSGFDPVMPVSFANGTVIPTVSNVQFLDPATIWATVKVTGRKRLKDPVLDLNVGSTFSYTGKATKANAFTITP